MDSAAKGEPDSTEATGGRRGDMPDDAAPPGEAPELVLVKICGLMREDDVTVLNEVHPDYVGFVFAPDSRRMIDLARALHLRGLLDHTITTVGVFVDQPVGDVADALLSGAIAVAQLHGDEDATYIEDLRDMAPDAMVIKAVQVADAAAITAAAGCGADFLLLDAGLGQGRTFDWELINQARAAGIDLPPFFLAGGLDADNVAAGIDVVRPYGVDVSSGVETNHHKDPDKIRDFVAAARGA